MESFRRLSTSEQLAQHLRRQIENGTLSGSMPGVQQLVRTLGVNSVAAAKAVQQLEHEGLVVYQGDRRSRLIAERAHWKDGRLKVGMLHYDAASSCRHDVIAIKQELMGAGHAVVPSSKSMYDLGLSVSRTARYVQAKEVDAWIIDAGTRHILEWFQQGKVPAFALHGRIMSVKMASAGIRKTPVISALVGKLVGLGHYRIVLLTREDRRKPELGFFERSFIHDLEVHGIEASQYNIPDWVNTPEGLGQAVGSLFGVTPPTALLVGDSELLHAVQMHLAARGIQAPRDVSLFCTDYEESFRWTLPQVAHIRWDHRPLVRRVMKWADSICDGRDDTRRILVKAHLHEGGTIGPARKSNNGG